MRPTVCFLLISSLCFPATPAFARDRDVAAERYTRCVREQSSDHLSTERTASTESCRTRNQDDNNQAHISIIYADPFIARTAPNDPSSPPATAIMFDLAYRTDNSIVLSEGYAPADFYRAVFVIGAQQYQRDLTISRTQPRGCMSTGGGIFSTSGCEYRELLLLALTTDDIATARAAYAANHAARITFRLHARRGGSLDMWIDAAEIVGMDDWLGFAR